MSDDFFDEILNKKKSDDLDDILDKIKNRWDTDLTKSSWDDTWFIPEEKEERDNEATSGRDVPKRANRSRKNKQRHRRRQ